MAKIFKALSQIRFQNTALKGVRRLEVDANWLKLKYVKYADYMLLGFIDPRNEAVSILIEVSNFASVYCSLGLNILKFRIVYHEKGVKFLGYKIWKSMGLSKGYLQIKGASKKEKNQIVLILEFL